MKLSSRTGLVLTAVLWIVSSLGIASMRAAEDKGKESAKPRPLEWPLYRGDAARSNRGAGRPPVLEALWRQPTLYGQDDLDGPVKAGQRAARTHLRSAEKLLQDRHEPIIPSFSPIAVSAQLGDKKRTLILHKNYFGVMGMDLQNGQLVWKSDSYRSLQRLLIQSGSKQAAVSNWLNDYEDKYPQILFENSTIGTLSTDGQFAYVVEDLAVPPYPRPRRENGRIAGGVVENQVPLDKDLEDAVAHNRLYALSLERSGALAWVLGEDEKGPLDDCYFLGPPLPLAGKLYVLADKQQEIRLICLEIAELRTPEGKMVPDPRIASIKTLGKTQEKMQDHPLRRTWAAHLAYGEGILVCPTNAGSIFGVDRRLDRLAWAYPYRQKREKDPKPWKMIAPVIAEGKVVFAPPDDPSLYCLNLADGSLLWSRRKSDDDVYLAGVYAGRVLIVGTKNVQALSLAKGEILWTQETGLPSGQGIAVGDAYYLPLQRGAQSKQPEILVLDINKGQVIAHHRTRARTPKGDDFEVPGNLVFVEGKLISLTPWEIVAYPMLGDK